MLTDVERAILRLTMFLDHFNDLSVNSNYVSVLFDREDAKALKTAIEALNKRLNGKWIEIKTRKPTEEEIQEYMNDPYFDIDDPEDLIFFDCQMPEDGQEVLITTSWGNVCIDTYVHEYGAFEDHEDHEDVVAWMPLPEPFKKEPEANDRPCEKCRHKVETKPGVEACDVWDCSFEPKDEQS